MMLSLLKCYMLKSLKNLCNFLEVCKLEAIGHITHYGTPKLALKIGD